MYITDRLNEHLPEHLHLTPGANADEALQAARQKGWTPEALADYLRRTLPADANGGLIIHRIRNAPPADTHNNKNKGGASHKLVVEAHPFDQDPNNIEGWCLCQLPRGNRHHTTGE